MDILISLIVGILVVEAYAWMPHLCAWIISRSANRVMSDLRERCREEWSADIEALPNSFERLRFALSLLWSGVADRINQVELEARCDQNDKLFEKCSANYWRYVEQLREIKKTAGGTAHEALVSLRTSVASLTARGDEQAENYPLRQKVTKQLERFALLLQRMAEEVEDKLAQVIPPISDRLDHLRGLLNEADMNRSQLIRLMKSGDASSEEMANLAKRVATDLQMILSAFNDNNWGDDEILAEHTKQLAGTLQKILDSCGEIRFPTAE